MHPNYALVLYPNSAMFKAQVNISWTAWTMKTETTSAYEMYRTIYQ